MSTEEDDGGILPKEGEDIKGKKHQYKAHKLLGKGGYGAVYEVERKSDGKKLAMKCELVTARKKVLMMDNKVLQGAQLLKSRHFCTIEDTGTVDERYSFLCMKLIGRNLWDLRVDRDDMRFTLDTALKVALQCLISIEELHRMGFLHRDIKPGNFAVGRPEANEQQIVHMLDFGLCRKFQVVKDKDVRKPRDVAPFRGTTRYAPLAAMKTVDQSRKDDIEGWLYMVAEWTSGALPWKHYKADNRDEVLKMKLEIRENTSLLDKFLLHCPKREFTRILKYLDTLVYYSIPDYKFVHYCVMHAFKTEEYKLDWHKPLDWDEEKYDQPKEEIGDGKPVHDEPDDDNKKSTAGSKK